jgi:hypothetical protein
VKRKLKLVAAAVVLVGVVVLAGVSLADRLRASPHEKVSATVGKANVTIEYGRPFKKGREIFGGLVPYGEVWRTGADEATTLTVDGEVVIGDLKLPPGSYALFTLPTASGWQLIVNKTAKQWGAFKYDASADLGRTAMTVSALPSPVEQLTLALKPAGDKALTLELSWDKILATVPVKARP